MKIFVLAIILMAFVFICFAIGILIKRNGKFPNLHIGQNEGLKREGVSCATSQDKEEQLNVKKSKMEGFKTILDKELEKL